MRVFRQENYQVTDAINRGALYQFPGKPWDDELLRENLREAFRHYRLEQESRQAIEPDLCASWSLQKTDSLSRIFLDHA